MIKRMTVILSLLFTLSIIITPVGKAAGDNGNQIVSIAKNYLGIPYRYGGTTTAGFDCSGYTGYVFKQAGIQLPRTSGQQYNVGTPVNKANLQSGDLVFFSGSKSSKISHVGIYIGNNQFISATSSKGIKIDSINDRYYWGSRYVGAKRVLPEVVETPVVEEKPVVTLGPGEFYDVSNNYWAYEQIVHLSTNAIMNGYGNGIFKPEKPITRAETAKILSTIFAKDEVPTQTHTYQDVPANHWAYNYIAITSEKQFFKGYEGNLFKPDEPISRAEIAELFARALELEHNGSNIDFKDLPSDFWAYDSIQILAANQIVSGYNDQTYKAENRVTRAEFSTLLYNALK